MTITRKLIQRRIAPYKAAMLNSIQILLGGRPPTFFDWIKGLLRRIEQLLSQRLVLRFILSQNKLPADGRIVIAIVHVDVLGEVLRAMTVVPLPGKRLERQL